MSGASLSGLFRFTGSIAELPPADRCALMDRSSTARSAEVRSRTAEIVQRVRDTGDDALRTLAVELDGVVLAKLDVPRHMWTEALDRLDAPLRRALERAARNIRTAHEAFAPVAVEIETEPGVIVGRRPDPLRRVGVYAPGGRAAYPSSVLMAAIPARVAGVPDVIVCTPPDRATGVPAPVVLAAAALADVDRVFAIGGAGAVAAMAYGTASVPRVDRVVGPGNAYVTQAKLQVAQAVGIDAPAGPSELLVIADARASAAVVAREALAQAEHDPEAAVVILTIGEATAMAVADAVERLIVHAPRRAVIEAALAGRGALLSASTLAEATMFATAWAPEHLLLAVADAAGAFAGVWNAGTVFLGESSSVAFGDYMTGANHVLPTGGLARAYSGLSTLDFVRWTTYQRVEPAAAARLATDVAVFAEAEGLPAHADAARSWSPSGAAA